MTLTQPAIAGGAWYAAISVATLAAFALDKARAHRPGARRIPERTLHTLSALGGFPGAIIAMCGLRHKNRKPGFVAITLGLAGLHVLGWSAAWWVSSRR